ncbi:MAG: hypothetical protein IPN42_07775 [Methylococcaceae bacterium]|nr:hypothetical protein [Methylococcaceae bacterium]
MLSVGIAVRVSVRSLARLQLLDFRIGVVQGVAVAVCVQGREYGSCRWPGSPGRATVFLPPVRLRRPGVVGGVAGHGRRVFGDGRGVSHHRRNRWCR